MSLSNEPQTTILLTIPHMLLRLCFQLRVSASKLALSKGFMDSCPLATSLNCEPCTSELMILVLAEYYPLPFCAAYHKHTLEDENPCESERARPLPGNAKMSPWLLLIGDIAPR